MKLLLILTACLQAVAAFVHPGVVVDQQQLDFMKQQTLAGVEPFASVYQKAIDSKWGSLSYTPAGPPSGGTIECGSYSKPNVGCTLENDDSEAAMTQALLWYISGNSKYADNAINILNTYSRKLKGGHTNSNAALQASWALQKFPAAAEILYYCGSGWSSADFDAFKTMLKTQYLGALQGKDLKFTNGNWAMTIYSAQMAIAVITEDNKLFADSVAKLQSAIPAYFYYQPEDSGTPKTSPYVSPKWNHQKKFGDFTNGICQETCRDLQHVQLGIAGLFNALETAHIQGADLYGQFKNRITTAMEFNTALIPKGYTDLGGEKIKISNKDLCRGKITIVAAPTWEIGYNHYHNRLGMSLPNTESYIINSVRQISFDSGAASLNHALCFETLHHGGDPESEVDEKEL